jgi:drug/metabolite transporter (DMT)-like permease
MSRVSVARLAGLSLIWGSSFLFIKVAVEGLSPAQLALARLTGGAVGGCPEFRGTSVAAPMIIRPLPPPPDPRTDR